MSILYHEVDPDGDVEVVLTPVSPASEKVFKTPAQAAVEKLATGVINGSSADQLIRVRVSSKHLTLASPVFKAMLQTSFREGKRLSSHGHTELPLPDDNPDAMMILLNLTHCKFKKVPRELELSMLTELAILVDKYELLEVTETLLAGWFRGFESSPPLSYWWNLLSLICISRVFDRPELFMQATKRAQLVSMGIIGTEKLPIPHSVLDQLNQSRQTAMGEIFAGLQTILKEYRDRKHSCPRGPQCGAMTLGSLTVGLHELGILQPPLPPYDKLSVSSLIQKIRKLEVFQYCKMNHEGNHYFRVDAHRTCEGVEKKMGLIVDVIENRLQGLQLAQKQ